MKVKRISKALMILAAFVALAISVPYMSLRMVEAQNNTPAFPPQAPVTGNLLNTCSGSGTLSSGVLSPYLACAAKYPNAQCQAWANNASARNYAAIGIGCAATTTATLTATATATATTAAYGGTTIATATATSTATTAAIGGLVITASTLNASPVVVYEMVR